MRIEITPGPLSGSVKTIASKSHAHRMLIASALCREPQEISISTTSADIEATKDCLAHLSMDIPVMNCGESGSTLRFMLPVTMALKDEAVFMGRGRLPYRKLYPLDSQMECHGCTFEWNEPAGEDLQEICRIQGRLQSGYYALPGNVSSQFITGLLFALPLLDGDSEIQLTSPLESSKYVDMTLDVLKKFGIFIISGTNADGLPVYKICGNQHYDPCDDPTVEGDWSNIAFWIIAGIINEPEHYITCENLPLFSLQGDKAIMDIAREMGGFVTTHGENSRTGRHELKAIDIDASDIPDLVPILAVAAAAANGTTHIYNAGRLRDKESDRLRAVANGLEKIGAKILEGADKLTIYGQPHAKLMGGTVSGYNDHRIVMAMTIASMLCENPVIIEGAEAVNKSYPTFFEDFKSLGGEFRVI